MYKQESSERFRIQNLFTFVKIKVAEKPWKQIFYNKTHAR